MFLCIMNSCYDVVFRHRTKLQSTNEELQMKKAYIESVEPQLAHGGKSSCRGEYPF